MGQGGLWDGGEDVGAEVIMGWRGGGGGGSWDMGEGGLWDGGQGMEGGWQGGNGIGNNGMGWEKDWEQWDWNGIGIEMETGMGVG